MEMNLEKKLAKMRSHTMVFTVADSESPDKPIGYCKLTNSEVLHDQKMAEDLVREWASEVPFTLDSSIEDLAYELRKRGYVWEMEQFCLELTEVAS